MTARVLERLRTPQAPDDDLASLTDQERRILDLIAEGLTNVLMKPGLSRRSEVGAYAARLAERHRGDATS